MTTSTDVQVVVPALSPTDVPIGPPSLWAKIQSVMIEAEYIRKDKYNDHHKYAYASEAAIKETVQPLLAKHRLLFVPRSQEIVSIEAVGATLPANGAEKKASQYRIVTLRLTYWWVDAETGEHIECTCLGQGLDNQDKAVYKSITGAVKYALTSTFLIPTGDGDPEANNGYEGHQDQAGRYESWGNRGRASGQPRGQQRLPARTQAPAVQTAPAPPPPPAPFPAAGEPSVEPQPPKTTAPGLPADHPQTIARRAMMTDLQRQFTERGVGSQFDAVLEQHGLKGVRVGEWAEPQFVAAVMMMRKALRQLGGGPQPVPPKPSAAAPEPAPEALKPSDFTPDEIKELMQNFRTSRGSRMTSAQLDKLIYSYKGTRDQFLQAAASEAMKATAAGGAGKGGRR